MGRDPPKCIDANSILTTCVSPNTKIGSAGELTGIQISAGSSPGSVVVTWEVPDSLPEDITFYHIRYWKADDAANVLNQQIQINVMILIDKNSLVSKGQTRCCVTVMVGLAMSSEFQVHKIFHKTA